MKSKHLISYHILSYHYITSYHFHVHFTSYHYISFNIISCYIISHHITSYHFKSFCIILYHSISFHIISYTCGFWDFDPIQENDKGQTIGDPAKSTYLSIYLSLLANKSTPPFSFSDPSLLCNLGAPGDYERHSRGALCGLHEDGCAEPTGHQLGGTTGRQGSQPQPLPLLRVNN